MIGIDTNILIRYLTLDDPTQSLKASKLIEDTISSGESVWINLLTLCEVVWVLEKSYQLRKLDIIHIIKTLTETKNFKIEKDEIVLKALDDYAHSSQVGFSDCLIGRSNEQSRCLTTYSFDKKAAKALKTFKSLS